jgi:hypothetical protein
MVDDYRHEVPVTVAQELSARVALEFRCGAIGVVASKLRHVVIRRAGRVAMEFHGVPSSWMCEAVVAALPCPLTGLVERWAQGE